jgi:hypothetical protein
MNAKQTAPLIVTLPALAELAAAAPPLIIVGAIGVGGYFLLKWLCSDDTEKKPEIVPVDTEAEFRRKEAETTVFRQIPADIPAKSAAAPERQALVVPSFSGGKPNVTPALSVSVPAPVPVNSVPATPKTTAPPPPPSVIPAMKIAPQAPPPPPIKKKFITREDLAVVFHRGARALSRQDAVAALKKLGFGKTAAYAALTPDGRFSAWLKFAPDGIITWTDR